ncbi:MAG TPA: hypothetical protein VIM73_23375 [Polyangiaceae bacterium]
MPSERQRRAPFEQAHVPLPTQAGVSPEQAVWLTHVPPVHRCGVVPLPQRVAFSTHPQVPVSVRHMGVAPPHVAWFTHALF